MKANLENRLFCNLGIKKMNALPSKYVLHYVFTDFDCFCNRLALCIHDHLCGKSKFCTRNTKHGNETVRNF